MEPRIQYAKTEDGVSIAFWTLGKGMPFVHMPWHPWSHIQMEWQVPEVRRWNERLAQNRMLVRYDGRGTGLSSREVTDYTLDGLVRDLEAVVSRIGLRRFALFGPVNSGAPAIAYAARHPERVSQLILWHTFARRADFSRSARDDSLRALRERDWELYTETVSHVEQGWSETEEARRFAALMRESVTPTMARAFHEAIASFDVTDLLPLVEAPTLVIHRRHYPSLDVGAAKELASRIPAARLALLEGSARPPYLGDSAPVKAAIDEFLGEGEEAAATLAPSGLVTILFTDMEGSTDLTQRLGDAGAQDCLRTHNTIVRDALGAHGGSEIKHTGDGIMASFASASKALQAAVAIQQAFTDHNQDSAHTTIRVRIGLNAGEPVAEDDDLFGTAVQLAARVCAQAEPGQILAANVVQELAAGKGFEFADKGEAELKGFEKPVRLHEVRWQD